MKTNNNIPVYRFQGHTDAWELRKLGEVATSFDYGLNSAATEYDGENKYLRITDIDDESRGFNISDLTSPEIDLFGLDEYRLNIGDIVFARTGASVGKSYIYRSIDGKVYFAGFLIRAKIKDNFNPDFVFQNTLTANYERFISITSMRSGQPGVNAQEYSNYEFMVPTLPEQEAIGSFFSVLDQLITLHQRKLDTLKEQKKTYLKLLFPAKGQTKPALRFQGFEDDWEEVKLGEVLSVSKLKNKENEYSKLDVLSVSREQGTVNQIEYQGRSFASDDVSGYKIVKVGQMIYTKSPLKGAPYGIFQTVTINGIVSPLYAVYNSSGRALASFVSLILKEDAIATHYLSPLVTKGAKNTINVTDEGALEGKVKIPTLPEQEAIGTFFQTLDQEITQVEDKLASLKEMKKTLLRKLFV